eukprot:5119168-Pyramimonas_sp.AAC.1
MDFSQASRYRPSSHQALPSSYLCYPVELTQMRSPALTPVLSSLMARLRDAAWTAGPSVSRPLR